jgi:rubrerythrin
MKAAVKKITEQVKALPENELNEFLSWLAEYEMGHSDEWDKEIERDFRNGGPLSPVLKRVRADIASGRTKPLDKVIEFTKPHGRAILE